MAWALPANACWTGHADPDVRPEGARVSRRKLLGDEARKAIFLKA
jgi:hypothetical protein